MRATDDKENGKVKPSNHKQMQNDFKHCVLRIPSYTFCRSEEFSGLYAVA